MARAKKTAETAKDEELLKARREAFCRYYAQGENTFGNATLSYAVAFDYKLDELSHEAVYGEPDEKGHREKIEDSPYDKAYKVCSVMGHRLLRNASIQERITVLLNELLKDEIVDAELVKVIKQGHDLTPKVQAIREYNKLRGRIIEKSQITQMQRLDMDDVRSVISVLPKERQDQFYATITDILAEAELLRSSSKA